MNYQENKQMLVGRAKEHKEADEIIKGKYWDGKEGCCVGCLAETGYKPHIKLSGMTNVPVWVFHLADGIHENIKDYENWPVRFSEALAKTPDGEKFWQDSENLWKIFICDLLLENERIWRKKDKTDEYVSQVVESINLIKKCAEDEIQGKEVDWSATRSALFAARSAAGSALFAAGSAAESATRSAARSATMSALFAAGSAARSATYERMADKFIKILEGE